jgi:hypothetical protein
MHRDEAERVKALLAYEILDTLPDPAFDEITRLAASICGAPYAFIGLVDWSRVWFKSRIGFTARQIPRTHSACQFAVLDTRPSARRRCGNNRKMHPARRHMRQKRPRARPG